MRVNILIFLKEHTNNDNFKKFKTILNKFINKNCYVCYPVKYDENTLLMEPWHKGAALALLYNIDWIDFDKYKQVFEEFLKNYKGNVLLGPFSKDNSIDNLNECTKWVSSINNNEIAPTILEDIYLWNLESGGTLICSQVDYFDGSCEAENLLKNILLKFQIKLLPDTTSIAENNNTLISLSPIYLYGSLNNVATFYNFLDNYLRSSEKDSFVHTAISDEKAKDYCSNGHFAIVTPITEYSQKSNFNYITFTDHLKTLKFGRILLHSDVMSSTLDIFNKCPYLISCQPEQYGITVLTRQQTAGIGRNNNQWISPIGSLLVSITYKIPNDTPLYKNASIIQHILSLAFVLAIKEPPGFSKLPIYIKWPNDIYYKDIAKIGGILVNNFFQGENMNVILSVGANIINKQPTFSLNQVIEKEIPLKKYTFTIEEVLARMLNRLEILLEMYNSDSEYYHTRFEQIYLKHLLKFGQEIDVIDPRIIDPTTKLHQKRKGIIRGINEYGYLKIALKDSREVLTVHPDGNRFDVTENPTIFVNNNSV